MADEKPKENMTDEQLKEKALIATFKAESQDEDGVIKGPSEFHFAWCPDERRYVGSLWSDPTAALRDAAVHNRSYPHAAYPYHVSLLKKNDEPSPIGTFKPLAISSLEIALGGGPAPGDPTYSPSAGPYFYIAWCRDCRAFVGSMYTRYEHARREADAHQENIPGHTAGVYYDPGGPL